MGNHEANQENPDHSGPERGAQDAEELQRIAEAAAAERANAGHGRHAADEEADQTGEAAEPDSGGGVERAQEAVSSAYPPEAEPVADGPEQGEIAESLRVQGARQDWERAGVAAALADYRKMQDPTPEREAQANELDRLTAVTKDILDSELAGKRVGPDDERWRNVLQNSEVLSGPHRQWGTDIESEPEDFAAWQQADAAAREAFRLQNEQPGQEAAEALRAAAQAEEAARINYYEKTGDSYAAQILRATAEGTSGTPATSEPQGVGPAGGGNDQGHDQGPSLAPVPKPRLGERIKRVFQRNKSKEAPHEDYGSLPQAAKHEVDPAEQQRLQELAAGMGTSAPAGPEVQQAWSAPAVPPVHEELFTHKSPEAAAPPVVPAAPDATTPEPEPGTSHAERNAGHQWKTSQFTGNAQRPPEATSAQTGRPDEAGLDILDPHPDGQEGDEFDADQGDEGKKKGKVRQGYDKATEWFDQATMVEQEKMIHPEKNPLEGLSAEELDVLKGRVDEYVDSMREAARDLRGGSSSVRVDHFDDPKLMAMLHQKLGIKAAAQVFHELIDDPTPEIRDISKTRKRVSRIEMNESPGSQFESRRYYLAGKDSPAIIAGDKHSFNQVVLEERWSITREGRVGSDKPKLESARLIVVPSGAYKLDSAGKFIPDEQGNATPTKELTNFTSRAITNIPDMPTMADVKPRGPEKLDIDKPTHTPGSSLDDALNTIPLGADEVPHGHHEAPEHGHEAPEQHGHHDAGRMVLPEAQIAQHENPAQLGGLDFNAGRPQDVPVEANDIPLTSWNSIKDDHERAYDRVSREAWNRQLPRLEAHDNARTERRRRAATRPQAPARTELSVGGKPVDGDYSEFSRFVHSVQEQNPKLAVPRAGDLLTGQVRELANHAASQEHLDLLQSEIDARRKLTGSGENTEVAEVLARRRKHLDKANQERQQTRQRLRRTGTMDIDDGVAEKARRDSKADEQLDPKEIDRIRARERAQAKEAKSGGVSGSGSGGGRAEGGPAPKAAEEGAKGGEAGPVKLSVESRRLIDELKEAKRSRKGRDGMMKKTFEEAFAAGLAKPNAALNHEIGVESTGTPESDAFVAAAKEALLGKRKVREHSVLETEPGDDATVFSGVVNKARRSNRELMKKPTTEPLTVQEIKALTDSANTMDDFEAVVQEGVRRMHEPDAAAGYDKFTENPEVRQILDRRESEIIEKSRDRLITDMELLANEHAKYSDEQYADRLVNIMDRASRLGLAEILSEDPPQIQEIAGNKESEEFMQLMHDLFPGNRIEVPDEVDEGQ